MDGETSPARMVKAARIDEQHLWRLAEPVDCGRQQWAFPPREQAGPVGRGHPTGHDHLGQHIVGSSRLPFLPAVPEVAIGATGPLSRRRVSEPRDGRRPSSIARPSRAGFASGVRQEAGAYNRRRLTARHPGFEDEARRSCPRQLVLELYQPLVARRPSPRLDDSTIACA
jgi:hypothetical protein